MYIYIYIYIYTYIHIHTQRYDESTGLRFAGHGYGMGVPLGGLGGSGLGAFTGPGAAGSACGGALWAPGAGAGTGGCVPRVGGAAPDPTYTGFIKSFNKSAGFGHISCGDTEKLYGKDVVVYQQDLGTLWVGDGVLFKVEYDLVQHAPKAAGLVAAPSGGAAEDPQAGAAPMDVDSTDVPAAGGVPGAQAPPPPPLLPQAVESTIAFKNSCGCLFPR